MLDQIFNSHSYSGFINFIYNDVLDSCFYLKDDSLDQNLNNIVSRSYFTNSVSQVINDFLFNSNGVYNFSNLIGASYKSVSKSICDDLVKYRYCLTSNKISSYIMDSSSFILTSKYQVDALGIIKGTEVFQAKLDDPDDCRVLLFDTRMNFHYNIVRKGSSTYLYFDLDVGNFINNSEVVYYMVDDRCDKVKAMCRNHKLNKISNG